jgi:hypothetical protein
VCERERERESEKERERRRASSMSVVEKVVRIERITVRGEALDLC